MTNILPWLLANLQFLAIIASVALALLIILAAGGIWAFGWYLFRWFEHAAEPEPYQVYGDIPHVPDEAKGGAG